ncbi:MAG: aminotransferase class V-fold PLP-dependent enzyme [Ruminococcus sp.]|nr:aminotransferase class V-fold PLP-dependent enzyme [Ruminococcus sp.]
MIYLDNGATTFPKPRAVVGAVCNSLMRFGANPGRSGHRLSIRASEILFRCREQAAELFGLDKPENIIFTQNCTTALNTVIHGLLKKGDHVVISSLEHNAVLRPVEALKDEGISYTVAEVVEGDDEKTISNFRSALRENTALVVCTHASNVFGVKLPAERIAALCRIYNIPFCLDAAQSAGIVPISLQNSCIDYLCAPGHKGLYGPMGTGLLLINSDRIPESLIQGGTGSLSSDRRQPSILPDRYESGTPNLPGIAGLSEGIRFVRQNGAENLRARELHLISLLYEGLADISEVVLYTEPPKADSHVPVLSFNLKNRDSEEVASLLSENYDIAVRAGLHCAPLAHEHYGTEENGTVRIVASAFTNHSQIQSCLSAINKISKKARK